jgi:hypothetical protein
MAGTANSVHKQQLRTVVQNPCAVTSAIHGYLTTHNALPVVPVVVPLPCCSTPTDTTCNALPLSCGCQPICVLDAACPALPHCVLQDVGPVVLGILI